MNPHHINIHPLPVPPALLVRDIGGILAAQDIRKANFLRQGVKFMRQFVEAIDPELLNQAPQPISEGKRESGSIRFDAPELRLKLHEPPTRTGLVLNVQVMRPDGSVLHSQEMPVNVLNQPGAWDHYADLINGLIRKSKKHH